jgi:hypothetical protein
MAGSAAASNAQPMPHLRVVPAATDVSAAADERPRVSLRLLMAASGRCSCDDCLLSYRRGAKTAGIISVRTTADRLTAVR